ncbi:EI24 domain-containing protein [Actibacterium lipolyticum]|uniref:CysZ-like protein n=1 Tax=Actibacterium lipolyticum TaxID=1524263 RepID=A0A238JN02_9RHOB|nr:EI24 domain-containing protein [Actibacterium lipolyticum]SMX31813.1 CysZ-like protein [Actibacterium lipolyticum]
MIFNDFLKSIAQLTDRRFRKVLWLGIGLTLILLAAITALFVGLIGWAVPDGTTLPFIGEVRWVGDLLSFAAVGLMIFLSIFLMVPVASAFTGLFLDEVAAAVEDRHYPHLPPAKPVGFYEAFRESVNFFGVLIAVNIVALIFYFFVGPFAPVLFWVVNGYLLGREYFQMVAARRIGNTAATALRKKHGLKIWAAGILMAMPLSVPLLNLLVPVLGAATFTHQFHRLSLSSGDSAHQSH